LVYIDVLLGGLFWVGLKFVNGHRCIYCAVVFYFEARRDLVNIRILTELKPLVFSVANNLNSEEPGEVT
jgi:hypothetical protein